MRRWLWIGVFAAAGVGGVAYWQLGQDGEPLPAPFHNTTRQIVTPKRIDDGPAEPSDTIEPLVVDRGGVMPVPPAPARVGEPAPRILLTPDMPLPPRPDAEPGKAVRMPYADE